MPVDITPVKESDETGGIALNNKAEAIIIQPDAIVVALGV
jgi:hypothetical protein